MGTACRSIGLTRPAGRSYFGAGGAEVTTDVIAISISNIPPLPVSNRRVPTKLTGPTRIFQQDLLFAIRRGLTTDCGMRSTTPEPEPEATVRILLRMQELPQRIVRPIRSAPAPRQGSPGAASKRTTPGALSRAG